MKVLFEDFFSTIKKNKPKEGRDSRMDFSKVIQERRTIRVYQDQSIDPKVIDSIMQATTLPQAGKTHSVGGFMSLVKNKRYKR